jgi:hypothetical protein
VAPNAPEPDEDPSGMRGNKNEATKHIKLCEPNIKAEPLFKLHKVFAISPLSEASGTPP